MNKLITPKSTAFNGRRRAAFACPAGCFLVLTLALLALASPLSAVTYTFNTGQNWSVATNWVGDVVPEFNNETDLIFNSPIGVAALHTDADRTVRSMTFGANLPTNGSTTISLIPRSTSATPVYKLTMEAASGNASIVIENGFGPRLMRYGTNSGSTITMDLASSLDLRVNDAAATFGFNDAFSGAGAINKYGSGLATATRNNSSFSGGINIFQGTFATHANAAASGTGAITLGGSGSADAATWGVGSTVTFANPVVVNAGAGARTISLFATATGNPTLSGGMTLNKDVIFDIVAFTNGTLDRITNSGTLTGPGGIVKTGSGLLVLSAANNYAGGTTVNAGTLQFNDGGSVLGNITNNATLSYNLVADSTAVGNTISGPGALAKSGAGTLVLSASNSYSGGTTLGGGVLRVGHDSALGAGTLAVTASSTLTSDGATARIITNAVTHASASTNVALVLGDATGTGDLTLSGPVSLGAGTGGRIFTVNNTTATIAGVIGSGSNSGSVVKNGTGLLLLSNTANTFTNSVSLQGGTLRVTKLSNKGTASSIGTMQGGTGHLQIGQNTSPGTLDYVGSGDTTDLQIAIGNGDGNGGNASIFNNGTGALVFNNPVFNVASSGSTARTRALFLGGANTNANEIQGVISDITSLNKFTRVQKDGTGTWILSGANTYTASTTINDGILRISPTGSLLFVIGGSGTNNGLVGAGIVSVEGQFVFNLAGASTETNATWTIVNPSLNATYAPGFLVQGFSTSGGGTWTLATNGVTYQFQQSTGVLSVQSSGDGGYNGWVSYWQGVVPGFTNTAPGADPDGDSFSNGLEFAFDGNPTVGTPALLRLTRTGANAVASWVERNTGVTYAVQSTTNLVTGPWTNAAVTVTNAADQSGISLTNDYTRKSFTTPAAGRAFFRVQATVAD